jgi:GH18 family chitinase
MNPSNVDIFVGNLVSEVNNRGWDGIDIDWEYPGVMTTLYFHTLLHAYSCLEAKNTSQQAPDIPGIPPGLQTDAPNYLAFLKKLRANLAPETSVSIAAPASYWYLKAFPITAMSQVVDYIVFMTYDLHGQWDYGNQYSQEGCVAGNCLRSHVNLTETAYALAMITKAGVPANKISVGVSSYGRAFGMTNQAACDGGIDHPGCTFVGPNSGATPGNCTKTAGYISNAEIDEIINLNASGVRYVFDAASDSDTLFYGNNWVAYMSDTTKGTRTTYYQGLNFAGTVDWAVDLSEFTDEDGDPDDLDDDGDPDTTPLAPCDASYADFDALDAAASSVPQHCVALYTLQALKGVLTETLSNYTDMINGGYDKKFTVYADSVSKSAGDSLTAYIDANGNSYATCTVDEVSICCSECEDDPSTDSYCDYCFPTGDCYKTCPASGCTSSSSKKRDGIGPSQVLIANNVVADEPCPPDYSKRGYGPSSPYEQTVHWTWTNSSGFFAALELDTGIPQSKTKMGDDDFSNDCAPSAGPDDDCWDTGMYYNVPLIDGYAASDVANPKDVVSKGLAKIQGLPGQIDGLVSQLKLDGYLGDDMELVDSLSMPVFMLASATENMATVEQIADKITEEERKAFILAFLSAIFLLIPVIGEVVGSVAELADVVAVTSLLGAAGNAATDIYTIVDDPANAPLAIFDLILSPLALADLAVISKAASVRRGMRDEDVAKLGDKVKLKMDTIEKLKGKCVPQLASDGT